MDYVNLAITYLLQQSDTIAVGSIWK